MKRNKIRYQSEVKNRPVITLTGKAYLLYVDDEAMESAQKGDLMIYPENDALRSNRMGEYGATGFSGYFKLDVCDGKDWCALLLNDIFPQKENHFSKTERPIDTYQVCREVVANLAGRKVMRTYREHYELQEDETIASPDAD